MVNVETVSLVLILSTLVFSSLAILAWFTGVFKVSAVSTDFEEKIESLQKLQNHSNLTKNNSTKNILIVARFRSGSTFTAGLISDRPDAYYVYEPLFVSHKSSADTKTKALFKAGLKQWEWKDEKNNGFYQMHVNSVIGDFYKRCWLPDQIVNNGLRNYKYSRHDCLKKDLKIAKVIRLKSVLDLKLLTEKKYDSDLKIIYLVRDPRGIANSRLETTAAGKQWDAKSNPKHLQAQLSDICKTYDQFLDDRSSSKFLKESAIVVRYEDVASNPFVFISKIYNFTNTKIGRFQA